MFVKMLLLALVASLVVAIVANRSEGRGPEERYVVKPYDTLWSIAASHYGGDPREGVWRIERANGLEGALIRPGQIITLP